MTSCRKSFAAFLTAGLLISACAVSASADSKTGAVSIVPSAVWTLSGGAVSIMYTVRPGRTELVYRDGGKPRAFVNSQIHNAPAGDLGATVSVALSPPI